MCYSIILISIMLRILTESKIKKTHVHYYKIYEELLNFNSEKKTIVTSHFIHSRLENIKQPPFQVLVKMWISWISYLSLTGIHVDSMTLKIYLAWSCKLEHLYTIWLSNSIPLDIYNHACQEAWTCIHNSHTLETTQLWPLNESVIVSWARIMFLYNWCVSKRKD